jgi:hypothetical protein
MTAFLTAVGATALAYAFVPTPKPVTRVVAVRIADTTPAAAAPAAPSAPAVPAAPAAPAANAWAVAGAEAAGAASRAGAQLDPSPPGVLAGGSLVADDLVAPCATLSLAGAVSRGLAGCP